MVAPKITVTILGVAITRILVVCWLYWSPAVLGSHKIMPAETDTKLCRALFEGNLNGSFPKLGVRFGGPHIKDYNTLESILGSPYLGKLPN